MFWSLDSGSELQYDKTPINYILYDLLQPIWYKAHAPQCVYTLPTVDLIAGQASLRRYCFLFISWLP